MEFRLLTTARERNIFAQRLAEARATHGASFKDVGPTQTNNRIRLASADVYALFESDCAPAESMVGGVALHDLEAFPQSCQQPDFSHLPPRSVLECSDHWSLSRGAGIHAWRGIAVQVVRREPCAVLIYLAVGGPDHGGFYSAMGFFKSGGPVEHPYLEGPDDGKLWVQPMILDGGALARLTASVRELKIQSLNDYQTIRFSKSDRLRPSARVDAQIPSNGHVQSAIAARAHVAIDAASAANL
ncbi:MAG: hypothetical protein Q7S58_17290 [Candidatus Binatus sp.]|uniref:hypothetical protein n=1 Tax=Candidatus Binatus sp. TaxID=2811406 RepID=UPI0027180C67|nr:hypothetical protein [Candidatus Binatus sp.]MDO8434156.1 hypothetical protein [Candidatus Binatus sp.]